MKRVIVDYAKLTNEILTLLVEKFPDGYDDADIIRFKNAKNETVEAVEVRTEDTIFLVKVSTKLADRIENYEEDDIDVDLVATPPIKDIEDEDISDDDEEEDSYDKDRPDVDEDDEDSDNDPSYEDDEEDED